MLLQLILTFIVFDFVNGDNTKGSLTFIIDEKLSMSDDVKQVKEYTNQIFDAVLSSNASKIDDFILVTFGDRDARLYTVTRNPNEFKNALEEIRIHENPDCPEYAMKGIELALKHSKPNSFFYVFTDATAKDYTEYDRIKSLVLKKSIQITFLLTGNCPDSLLEANAVYDKLAAATNGQVFHLEKQDIRKIMPYIIASVNFIKTTVAHKVFSNGFNKNFQFSIDSKVWDVIISVSGVNPRYHITDPDGITVEENTFISTEKSHISKLEAKLGVYTMHLDSVGATSIVITGSTSISFQYGFSTVEPNTLNETSTKPISGLPTYLSIVLDNIAKDVLLDTVEMRDFNDNVISEVPLTLIDKNQQFYVTKPFLTPNSTFKLAINGHTKSKEKITRVALTTIEPQIPELEGPKPKKPIVTILEGDKITKEYDKQTTLKCKVNAYPKPNVIWQDNLKTLYSSTIVPVDLPYEYLSILNIEKVNKNVTVQCKAVNVLGEDSKSIAVELKQKYVFEILEFPENATIEYGVPAKLNFKVNAFPLVNITWFKNGNQIINNSDYEVSSDGSTSISFQYGFSTVEPNTLNETSTKPISGLPTYLSIAFDNINKDVSLDTVEIRDINDNIISKFSLKLIDKNQQFYVTEPFSTPNSTFNVAINGHTKSKEKITGVALTTIEPQIPELEGPKPKKPIVTILEGDKITGEYDKQTTLKCKVNAYPKPNVIWQDNLKTLYSSTIVPVDLPYEYLSILKIEKVNKNVTVQCKAVNVLGEDSKSIAVELKQKYVFEILEFPENATIEYGVPAKLNFKVNAFPLVNITWFKNGNQIINNSDYEVSSDGSRVIIKQMRNELKGNYTVEVYNDGEKINHEFKLDMFGVIPVINKSISEYEARKGFNVNISCRILESKPTPVISWIFKPEGLNIRIPLKETTETLHLNNVGLEQNGIYSCEAQNEFGRDSHEVDLHVIYPPTIQNIVTQLPKGELVILNCTVAGFPLPTVRWFFNKVAIENRGKYIYNNSSLSFIGSVQDNGIYTCEATNTLGNAKKDVYVNIYIPIKMAEPKDSTFKLTVGDSANLVCYVEGYPKPKVQWTFFSENSSIPLKLLRADSTGSLFVEHVQVEDEGLYRCDARNVGGLKSITYKIQVKEPVSILANPLGVTTYDAVKGDLALRIPCKTKGNPKPEVTWETKGYNIASGTDWFDIEEDGTLVIKHLTLNSAGSYICRASNAFSSDLKEFTVNVTPYLQLDFIAETLNLESGTSHHVECGLPHGDGDVVNWFKHKRLITSGELYLRNITINDSGVYSCRVSTFTSTHTIHKEVIVGYKPYFVTEEASNIDFIKGKVAYLNCFAYGEPEPQIIWRHNGNVMNTSDMGMNYTFEIKQNNIESYECVVSNKFGNINRNFNIKNTKECLLDIKKDFNKHQPLLLSRSRQWPDLKKINHFIRIPKSTHLLFACPGNTVIYNGEEFGEYVETICVDNSIFKIRQRNVDFAKLKCKEEIKSVAKSTNQRCFSDNTELLNIGYYLQRNLLRVYDICIDKDNKIPLYTRYNLRQGISGTIPKESLKFTGSKHLPFFFEDMYKFSPADVIPGLSQVSTYNYLNVIPQWSSCGSENWDEIERRIRSLAMLSDINISVFTGSSHPIRLPGQTSPLFLSDRFKNLQRVPMYMWKVIQNTHDGSSLAIVQFNVPNITLSEALSSMPCKDICDEVEWMKNYQWHNVEKGFTFCCSIADFSRYYGKLIKGHDKVFKTFPLVSDHSLI